MHRILSWTERTLPGADHAFEVHSRLLMKLHHSLAIISITLSGFFLVGCQSQIPTPTSTPISTPTASSAAVQTNSKLRASYEFTAFKDGQAALELIDSGAKIETKDFGTAGKFITSINGLPGNNEYYWAFYLNGGYAEAGVSQTRLKKGDVIRFVYEAVSPIK